MIFKGEAYKFCSAVKTLHITFLYCFLFMYAVYPLFVYMFNKNAYKLCTLQGAGNARALKAEVIFQSK